ncbi:MAG: hypothetical protein KJO21_11705 [Verrucomicrobiae bacterium]|nr:hypothetical protein [Verrucomicrobiae bacterium]NNJ43683.1 hypothetical protein [Akkermansiaceae bacterium]
MDPTKVDGVVAVDVDRTERVWTVEVTNASKQALRYEMMGKVPRGLGLEVWDPDKAEYGVRVHAENLAQMNMDVFPADIREIAPGTSEKFHLNPASMSTTSDLTLAKWERAKRYGYYECRVFFGVYASRLLSVAPRDRLNSPERDKPKEDAPLWSKTKDEENEKNAIFGFKLRRMLNEKSLAIVSWHRGSDSGDDYYITYTTCPKAELEAMKPMDENKTMEIPLPKLIAKAQAIAKKKLKDCTFEGLMINPCEDDDKKHYASVYFVDDRDDTEIDILLNGVTTETTKLSVTKEQYKQLKDYRIPKIREQDGAGQPATAPELKPKDRYEPQPESEGRSR